MTPVRPNGLYRVSLQLPEHLQSWELPPGWTWGAQGLYAQHRHYQEIIDALDRSLSLVSAPDAAHHAWLESEAKHLAHRNHMAVPTTYHYWASFGTSRRGPGYLRRWIPGETVCSRLQRAGADDVPAMLRLLREVGSALSYLHDGGSVHGCVSSETIWMAPMGRLWLLGWQWAVPKADIPDGLAPEPQYMAVPDEWRTGAWLPTQLSDQWQLAALCFESLTGERPPSVEIPPLGLMRPDCPKAVALAIDRALSPDPTRRYPSVSYFVRAVDHVVGSRTMMLLGGEDSGSPATSESEEVRLRWATADDYEVLSSLGSGSFGSVWRVRDLSLGREVALKLLHPHVARDQRAVARFRREAKLAAQLAHPAIVPIYDWDDRGEVAWYTMELAEGGSVADLVARSGPRPLSELAPQVDFVLGGLAAAHAVGITHRDLKPENILIDRYWRWRIADFGIANPGGEEATGASGTPAFAPPEQLLGEQQDASADCFSLAAIVAFALTGKAPFGERDTKVILARELKGELDVSELPEEIGEWLRHAMSPRAEDRFSDVAEMQTAWRSAVEAVFARERHVPFWKRWFATAENEPVRREV